MPKTVNQHQQASPGVELRNHGYAKAATKAALDLITGQPGEIQTVTATGDNYHWDDTSATWRLWLRTPPTYALTGHTFTAPTGDTIETPTYATETAFETAVTPNYPGEQCWLAGYPTPWMRTLLTAVDDPDNAGSLGWGWV